MYIGFIIFINNIKLEVKNSWYNSMETINLHDLIEILYKRENIYKNIWLPGSGGHDTAIKLEI